MSLRELQKEGPKKFGLCVKLHFQLTLTKRLQRQFFQPLLWRMEREERGEKEWKERKGERMKGRRKEEGICSSPLIARIDQEFSEA